MSKNNQHAQEAIRKTMREFYESTLKTGVAGKKVTDHKQALAIGISKAKSLENYQETSVKGDH